MFQQANVTSFHRDLRQQGSALQDFCERYGRPDAVAGIAELRPGRVVLVGMGASFHAAMWGSHVLRSVGIRASAIESSELLHFGAMLVEDADALVLISQSGTSAEVVPLLDRVPAGVHVVGITNNADSPLARRAGTHLDIAAGAETTVACKTYVNTLAGLWLAASLWTDRDAGTALGEIASVARRIAFLTDDAEAIGADWCDRLLGLDRIVFTGHGPHVPAARQGAMMMAEWMKREALGLGLGAFRHGFIEFTDARTGVVVLGAGGATDPSVALLCRELRALGATVLSVVEGRLAVSPAGEARTLPEPLSALLDVVPMQIFVETGARRLGIEPSFRHIGKVIASI
jgi:glucosamine--fructose-6-phosphate aminotransferase (isomerizing)